VRSEVPYRSPEDLHSRGVLRRGAGTILLSGTLWPIASFGSPGGHNLSLGTQAQGPSPAFQWMLSPVTGSLPVRRARLCERQLPPRTHRFRPVLLRRFQSGRVVLLARPPQCQHDRGDLTREGQLRQVRLRATIQEPLVVAVQGLVSGPTDHCRCRTLLWGWRSRRTLTTRKQLIL